MPILQMTLWIVTVIAVLSVWRLRSWREIVVVAVVSGIILMFSQMVFYELVTAANIDPAYLLSTNTAVLQAGPFGWLALLIMPLGWLGPLIGAGLVQRWQVAGRVTA